MVNGKNFRTGFNGGLCTVTTGIPGFSISSSGAEYYRIKPKPNTDSISNIQQGISNVQVEQPEDGSQSQNKSGF